MSYVIVYGSQGCGKTQSAEALAKHFNAKHVVDGATIEQIKGANQNDSTLYLTNDKRALEHGALHFKDVAEKVATGATR